MPFEAAKAVAATFCYRIRYVLTPVFGLDFPAQCIPPESSGFESMHISPKIIRRCTEAVSGLLEPQPVSMSESRSATPSSSGGRSWTPVNAPCKARMTAGSESGYGTDTERSEISVCSPRKLATSKVRRSGTPHSVGMQRRYRQGCTKSVTSIPYIDKSESSDDCKKRKRNLPRGIHNGCDSPSTDSPKQCASPSKRRKASSAPAMTAENAAMVLLELGLRDATLRGKDGKSKKRRASA